MVKPSENRIGILLRFRDLVTEPRGNISEHRRIIDEMGFAWWGWWARSEERVPTETLSGLVSKTQEFPVVLFDSGLMEHYLALCTKVAVAPSDAGISSPNFRATPHYYVRGSYPAWFKLHGSLGKIEQSSFKVVSRPTLPAQDHDVEDLSDNQRLRDDRPTLWEIELAPEAL